MEYSESFDHGITMFGLRIVPHGFVDGCSFWQRTMNRWLTVESNPGRIACARSSLRPCRRRYALTPCRSLLQMLSRTRRAAASDDSRQDKAGAVQPYAQMQKSMMDELERRRDDWEKEMQRMQEDFFKVQHPRTHTQTLCTQRRRSVVKHEGSGSVRSSHQTVSDYTYISDFQTLNNLGS